MHCPSPSAAARPTRGARRRGSLLPPPPGPRVRPARDTLRARGLAAAPAAGPARRRRQCQRLMRPAPGLLPSGGRPRAGAGMPNTRQCWWVSNSTTYTSYMAPPSCPSTTNDLSPLLLFPEAARSVLAGDPQKLGHQLPPSPPPPPPPPPVQTPQLDPGRGSRTRIGTRWESIADRCQWSALVFAALCSTQTCFVKTKASFGALCSLHVVRGPLACVDDARHKPASRREGRQPRPREGVAAPPVRRRWPC